MIAIIGCGNANRRDDGAGVEVIRALTASGRLTSERRVKLLDAGTDGMAVMFAAKGCETLVVVDCCRSGSEPGAVFEGPGEAFAAAHRPAFTLHDFRWDHALDAGRKIYRDDFPRDVVVLLIEGLSFDFGVGLSPAVKTSVARVASRIEEIVRERVRREGPGP